ncbi:hypothetical protein ABMA28_002835 [Loxostege sticticalis]|uniref:Mos1 transposase HTH domain-containing protein n=1 Tax=Loxostege sticticalis TaxID=481309 RepID=A0ABD0SY56_LOXSC
MSESNEEIRYILKFNYKKGKNATQAAEKKICNVYRPSAVSVRMQVALVALLHKTVLAHLKQTGYTKKLDIWVPHELTERNLMNCVLICDSLLRRNETEPFLKKLITGDEKWITYDKNVQKRSWSKAGQASQTMMLSVWWDWKGIIHYEVLPPSRTIDSELYCEQLIRLKQEVERKRPELINRRGVFGWEVFMHSPYSPDLAPSDFHLFRSLQNSLGSPQNFYSNGIMSLPTRWQKAIEQNGTYIL